MRTIKFMSLALSFLAVPALAAPDPVVVEGDKIVCKRNPQSYVTGSRVSRPKKICMTASDWELADKMNEQNIRDSRERGPVEQPEAPRAPITP